MRSLTNISPRPQGTMTLVVPKQTVTFIVSQWRLCPGRNTTVGTTAMQHVGQKKYTHCRRHCSAEDPLAGSSRRLIDASFATKSTADVITCRPVIHRQQKCLHWYVPRSFGYRRAFSDHRTDLCGGHGKRYGIIARTAVRRPPPSNGAKTTTIQQHWLVAAVAVTRDVATTTTNHNYNNGHEVTTSFYCTPSYGLGNCSFTAGREGENGKKHENREGKKIINGERRLSAVPLT